MKILGLIASLEDPASRARIIQYKEPFADTGLELSTNYFAPFRNADPAPWTYNLKKITGINEWRTANAFKLLARLPLLLRQYQYDIIWQNRLLLPHHIYFEKKYNRPLVFDYDDAIWLDEGEKEVIAAISRAALVLAGNEYLAEFARSYSNNIHIVPTPVDTDRLYPLEKTSSQFTIGWIGSKSNFPYLQQVRQPIQDFLVQHKDSRFIIVSSEVPPGFPIDGTQIIFKTWDGEKENEFINEFSVGLMPLDDNFYTRGKCSYKMLQYMACGKPVIVSPVGMNNKILAEDEPGLPATNEHDWLKALTILRNDSAFFKECCVKGRKAAMQKYSLARWSATLIDLFKKQFNG